MSRVKLAYIGAAAATVTIHVAAFGGLNAMKKPEPEKHTRRGDGQRAEAEAEAQAARAAEADRGSEGVAAASDVQRAAPPKPAAAPPPPIRLPPRIPRWLPCLISASTSRVGSAGPVVASPCRWVVARRPLRVAPKPKEKVLGAAAERPAVAGDDCAEDLVKAKPQGFVKPTYTDDARAAGIEGRVRVEVSLDETGKVLSARVVSGLGHGLDESAIDAAKRMAFNSATRCGKSVKSTFVVSMRFVLGE